MLINAEYVAGMLCEALEANEGDISAELTTEKNRKDFFKLTGIEVESSQDLETLEAALEILRENGTVQAHLGGGVLMAMLSDPSDTAKSTSMPQREPVPSSVISSWGDDEDQFDLDKEPNPDLT